MIECGCRCSFFQKGGVYPDPLADARPAPQEGRRSPSFSVSINLSEGHMSIVNLGSQDPCMPACQMHQKGALPTQ